MELFFQIFSVVFFFNGEEESKKSMQFEQTFFKYMY